MDQNKIRVSRETSSQVDPGKSRETRSITTKHRNTETRERERERANWDYWRETRGMSERDYGS